MLHRHCSSTLNKTSGLKKRPRLTNIPDQDWTSLTTLATQPLPNDEANLRSWVQHAQTTLQAISQVPAHRLLLRLYALWSFGTDRFLSPFGSLCAPFGRSWRQSGTPTFFPLRCCRGCCGCSSMSLCHRWGFRECRSGSLCWSFLRVWGGSCLHSC